MKLKGNLRALPALAVLWLAAGASASAARVTVLEDFENSALRGWTGPITSSAEPGSHGARSGAIRFDPHNLSASLSVSRADWRGYDRLLFDLYSGRQSHSTLTLRIDDAEEAYEGTRKIFVAPGWNHVEVVLRRLRVASERRALALDSVRRITLSAAGAPLPWSVRIDNLRLVSGEEGAATRSRTAPGDVVTVLDDRFFDVRQVARPGEVPEAPDVARLRAQAEQEAQRLRDTVAGAQVQGIETIYAERHLVIADLGLRVRPLLAWFNNDPNKRAMFSYAAASCRRARIELEDLMAGRVRLPGRDDTQAGEPLVPPLPPLNGRPVGGWFFRDDRGAPLMVLSVHSPSRLLERFFASPRQHIESYSVGGGSRWTIDASPVYEAFQRYPDTHRVGWDGWCGHLVRDLSSMGTAKRENVVICLESPHTREAVAEYIRRNIPRFHANPQLLYDILAYELMYICYCDRSQQMFRKWLAVRHGSLEAVNQAWGTSYPEFAAISAPPVKNSRPLPGTNRAQWFDWASFNQDRFTDYLLWVKETVHRLDARVPLAAGGSSSMLAGRTGTTGIDEEQIINRLGDVIIHEGGGSTLDVDLQLSLSDTPKPLADPEMSLGSVYNLLPHFLHGKSVAQIFHWPSQPSNEFHSVNRSSLAHGWGYSLEDVSEVLRVALDVRRLSREIAAFVEAPAEVAILYSKTSTLQLPPEMLTWQQTPYLAELEKTYEAGRYLDARLTFITERQIRRGLLSRYKLLLVPGARNVTADAVEGIRDWVAAGGHAVITPESLLADEYNRPRDYLARWGIQVRQTRRPKPGTPGALVQGYDQSFAQEISFVEEQPLRLTGPGDATLTAAGVRQSIATSGEVLFHYPDGGAAVARVRSGRGTLDYLAASLETRGFARLLDRIYEDARVPRPVRFVVRGAPDVWKIEARAASLGSRRLVYITNTQPVEVEVAVEARDGRRALQELRGVGRVEGNRVFVPPHQTVLCERGGE